MTGKVTSRVQAEASPAPGRRLRGRFRWFRRFLDITNAWLLGAALLSLLATVQTLHDTDVWWHIALGRYISQHGIPTQEPFSFTPPVQPWVGQQWLYEVVLAKLVAVTPLLPTLAMGVLTSAVMVLAARSLPQRLHVPGGWLAASLLLNVFGAAEILGVRGQVITVAGSAVVMWVLTHWRDGDQRPLWLLPPLLLLWCNLHAGFVTAFALLLVAAGLPHTPRFGIVGRRRPLLIATAISLLVTLINPSGWKLYGYIADTFTNSGITQMITEWQSPNFHDPWLRLFELSMILLVAAWTLAPKGPDLFDVVFAGGSVLASLQAQRNIPIYAVIAIPQLARYGHAAWQAHCFRIYRSRSTRGIARPLAAATTIILLLLVGGGVAVSLKPLLADLSRGTYEATAYPQATATYAIDHFPGQRIYSSYEYGGYLAYRMPTGRVILIYGESAIFGNTGLQHYLDVHILRRNWSARLDSFGTKHAILGASAQEVAAFYEIGWRVDCYDSVSGTVVMSQTNAIAQQTAPPSPTEARAC